MSAQIYQLKEYQERRVFRSSLGYTATQVMQEMACWNARSNQEMAAFWTAFVMSFAAGALPPNDDRA